MSGRAVVVLIIAGVLLTAAVTLVGAHYTGRPPLREDATATAVAMLTPQASAPSPTATPERATVTSTPQLPTASATRRAPTTPTLGSPRPTATFPPDVPVTAAFRSFAGQINDALARKDVSFFRGRAATSHIICTTDDVPSRGAGGKACDSVGQEYEGLSYGGWRSEGAIVLVDRALSVIERLWTEEAKGATDDFGGSAPKVYALASISFSETPQSGAIITALIQRPENFAGTGPLRVAVVTHWSETAGAWRMPFLLSAYVLGDEFLTNATAVRYYLNGWERY